MVVVWFKRDLRVTDHEPLVRAIASGQKILLLYSFEPLWTQDPHYSEMHLNFIKQSLEDLQGQLAPHGTKMLIVDTPILQVLECLQQHQPITQLFSHQETGMKMTYDRDKAVARWCREQGTQWHESVNNGVFRGLKNRLRWKDDWVAFINAPIVRTQMEQGHFYGKEEVDALIEAHFTKVNLHTPHNGALQRGGSTMAVKYLRSFVQDRMAGYNAHYSKPLSSRLHSSRLSPYLAWGNISTRQVCQFVAAQKDKGNKRQLSAFLSRMRWQAHFIQKFEMEGSMEFHSVNKGYHALVKEKRPQLQKAWREGQTGVPMVDAAMRCLTATGFVNFRLRAMLASFFTHLLWQPWQDCTEHLARHFLDFEPGIHFPQLNMQSGETGVNTIRIYNPVKNGKEHDPSGAFVKKWVPELAQIPAAYVHEPWTMPPMEQAFLGFELGKDYPRPIVDLKKMRTFAGDTLYAYKKRPQIKKEGHRIVKKHTLPGRPVWDRHD
ncbi:deoxyribodipyrimidine photo-lyase/cryptochrome family protein [Maribacter sp. 2307ULW6-5]|uniref:cryptochrome/deoxyribodipyrimidine photo-lyase family protein n=1 Tax=Maribacter sp. 2307ULW6-5 TaxID=3386275 RepID=UPI0039BCCAE5